MEQAKPDNLAAGSGNSLMNLKPEATNLMNLPGSSARNLMPPPDKKVENENNQDGGINLPQNHYMAEDELQVKPRLEIKEVKVINPH